MNPTRTSAVLPTSLVAAVAALLPIGCAGIQLCRTHHDGDVRRSAEETQRRRRRQFDEQRDSAEFQAAKARWEQQDSQGAARRWRSCWPAGPSIVDARLLMVELLLAADDSRGGLQARQGGLGRPSQRRRGAIRHGPDAGRHGQDAPRRWPTTSGQPRWTRGRTTAYRDELAPTKRCTPRRPRCTQATPDADRPAGSGRPRCASLPAGRRRLRRMLPALPHSAGVAADDPAGELLRKGQAAWPRDRPRRRWNTSARRPPPSPTTRKSPSRAAAAPASQPAGGGRGGAHAGGQAIPQLGRHTPHVGGGLLPHGRLQIIPSCTPASTFVGQVECPILLFNGMYVGEARAKRGRGSPLPAGRGPSTRSIRRAVEPRSISDRLARSVASQHARRRSCPSCAARPTGLHSMNG